MGLRPKRSTIDNIFIVRQIYDKCYEYNTDLHKVFIDISKLLMQFIEMQYIIP